VWNCGHPWLNICGKDLILASWVVVNPLYFRVWHFIFVDKGNCHFLFKVFFFESFVDGHFFIFVSNSLTFCLFFHITFWLFWMLVWDGIFGLSVDRRGSPLTSANAPTPFTAIFSIQRHHPRSRCLHRSLRRYAENHHIIIWVLSFPFSIIILYVQCSLGVLVCLQEISLAHLAVIISSILCNSWNLRVEAF